ncbi:hypothetical protein FHS43_003998 [Streptosporangium becharense]|uniref:Secreted protein n=1 Tax=Streptosporangium becharense TaxID=1816182 RepID=A0A7W9IH39_9ACTN|nr:DUF6049 family protein [Streptosporangium becharense]MBB2912715.1 hypothetical protein [Streptosporangium becharense]MBB5820456.1 hypothetical protein [Streptosporangium becharense]
MIPIHKAALLTVLTTTLFMPAAVVVPDAASARTTTVSRLNAQLVLEEIGPDAPREPTTEIKVAGSLVNAGTETLAGLRIQMRYAQQPFTQRAELDAYLSGQGLQPGAWRDQRYIQAPLAPSAKTPWEFTFTPQLLSLTRFGVYPIMIEVLDSYGQQIATQRTVVTYMPRGTKVARTKLAMVLPIIDQPRRSDDATFVDEGLPAAMASGQRLGDLLKIAQDTASAKGLTWVVDPALLDDARAMGRSHTVRVKDRAQQRPASTEATTWLDDLRTALADHPVVATPYADPDVTALAHNGVDDVTGSGIEAARTVAQETLGREVITNVNWPVSGMVDYDALDLLATSGVDTVLLNVLNLPPSPPPVTTPDATAALESVNGTVTALVADAALSETVGADTSVPGAALANRQRFIAETAMISAEPVTGPRTVVAAPHRRWAPDPKYVTDLVETASSLPWLAPATIDTVKRRKGAVTPRAGLTYTDDDRRRELGKQYMTSVRKVGARADLTSAITSAPDVDVFDLAMLRLASSAWRGKTDAAAPYVQQVGTAVDGRIGKVSITGTEQSRLRTLAGTNGDVPISVRNDLEGPRSQVLVRLRVTSDKPDLLRIEPYEADSEPILIEGGQNRIIPVQMTAAASGQTTVTVQLTTADGRKYGAPVELTVRTTGYTGIALVIVGAALAVMLAAVVLRVLRQRRGRRGPASRTQGRRAPEPATTES